MSASVRRAMLERFQGDGDVGAQRLRNAVGGAWSDQVEKNLAPPYVCFMEVGRAPDQAYKSGRGKQDGLEVYHMRVFGRDVSVARAEELRDKIFQCYMVCSPSGPTLDVRERCFRFIRWLGDSVKLHPTRNNEATCVVEFNVTVYRDHDWLTPASSSSSSGP